MRRRRGPVGHCPETSGGPSTFAKLSQTLRQRMPKTRLGGCFSNVVLRQSSGRAFLRPTFVCVHSARIAGKFTCLIIVSSIWQTTRRTHVRGKQIYLRALHREAFAEGNTKTQKSSPSWLNTGTFPRLPYHNISQHTPSYSNTSPHVPTCLFNGNSQTHAGFVSNPERGV